MDAYGDQVNTRRKGLISLHFSALARQNEKTEVRVGQLIVFPGGSLSGDLLPTGPA